MKTPVSQNAEMSPPLSKTSFNEALITSAKDAAEKWGSINRAPSSTAKQIVLGLSLTGHVDENFEPSLLQGYLEAIGHPSEERNGKIYFLWQ